MISIRNHFFGDFRVSVMLDRNGSNSPAAAAVAYIGPHMNMRGKRAVVLAGTGPVGQRAAVLVDLGSVLVAAEGPAWGEVLSGWVP